MNRNFFYKKSKRIVFLAATLITGVSAGTVYATKATQADVQPHSDNVPAALNDTGITTKIKTKLLQDKNLKGSDIHVITTNGVVTLEGMAANSRAKSLAQKRAESVKGVKSVDNNLTVPTENAAQAKSNEVLEDTSQAVSDSWITTKVKTSILTNNISKEANISVKTEDGVVVLSGVVASQRAIDHLKQLAAGVKSVKWVNTDGLTVTQH